MKRTNASLITIFSIVLSICFLSSCDPKEKAETNSADSLKETQAEFDSSNAVEQSPDVSQKKQQIAFLNLNEEEVEGLPEDLANYHEMIVENTNYASGISIAPILKQLNKLIDIRSETRLEGVEQFNAEIEKHIQDLYTNPRVNADHFHSSGRLILKKIYHLQSNQYPKLSGQTREIKSALGEIKHQGSLQGQSKLVREFFDQTFIFFYLIEEE